MNFLKSSYLWPNSEPKYPFDGRPIDGEILSLAFIQSLDVSCLQTIYYIV